MTEETETELPPPAIKHFIVFGPDNIERRRGSAPPEMVAIQASGEGETVVEYEPTPDDPSCYQIDASGKFLPYDAPLTDADMRQANKAHLSDMLRAGYPSEYGPVDIRDGAKVAMMTSLALGRGMNLILLDNSIITLDYEALKTLFDAANTWEQTLVLASRLERNS